MIKLRSGAASKARLKVGTNIETLVFGEEHLQEVMPASPSTVDYLAKTSEERLLNVLDSDFPYRRHTANKKYK